MNEATSLLYDLAGFRVVSVEPTVVGVRQVVIMQTAVEHPCPRCGVIVGGKPYDVRCSRVKDLPVGHRGLEVTWRKRRYRCPRLRCQQKVFTERSEQIPPRHRLTGRLRQRLERAASTAARALSDVACEYGVSWWACTAPWSSPLRRGPATSFVDLDTGRPGWLLGLTPGRSGAAVTTWLGARDQAWRDQIEIVALDPSAPFAAAIRRLLPRATIVVDHWHLVRLANQMLTDIRQRVAREQLGRRGGKNDPAWAHRRLLLAAGNRLSRRGLARLSAVLATDDPTNEIGAAWGIKELLRMLLTRTDSHRARRAPFAFYDAVLLADMPETTRLAETIQTWWPAIEAFLRLRVTNARTEATNTVIKQIKRLGCGYRNQANYERHIILHVAAKNAA